MTPQGQITRLIMAWQRGDETAEKALFEVLYRKLHLMAVQTLRREPQGRTLGPTDLVHEAYLRFRHAEGLEIANSQHFLTLAARVMRRILVDRARARLSDKRGGARARTELTDQLVSTTREALEILAVDRALDDLARQSARQAHLVELRFFAGYSEEESAVALGISARTARREWQLARTRLRLAIDGLPNAV
jgi:RNA polymerase sigma-70 factor (ECF subfamily)